ncbi:MAG: hypothetical protein R2757_09905 [Draconibacterium sp.]
MDLNSILQKHQITPGTTKSINIGCILLSATRLKDGWQLVTTDNCPDDDINLHENSAMSDYFQTGKSNSLIIAPALPNKPLVFKGSGLNVLPGQKITIFLKIPLTFQIYFSKVQPENLLREITYKRLSNTWFGEPDSGEPAFTLGSEYFLDFDEIKITGFEAICPVSVKNSDNENLNVQRLIIRDEHLSLYKNENKMVTSLVEIEFKGKDTIGAVDYHYSKLYNGEKQEILAKPRNSSGKGLKLNFHFMKTIYRTE